jgi:hypothetical protein
MYLDSTKTWQGNESEKDVLRLKPSRLAKQQAYDLET